MTFAGKEFFLLPFTKEFYSSIAIRCRGSELRNYSAQESILHFLSAMCWYYNDSVNVVSWGNSSSGGILNPGGWRMLHNKRINSCLHMLGSDAMYLYNLQNDKTAKKALSFYREGLSLGSSFHSYLYYPAYSFLSFYKILELCFPKSGEKIEWIGNQLLDIAQENSTEAKKSYQKIVAINSNVSGHIWMSGRNAAAHAHEEPSYDPGDFKNWNDFFIQLPLIRRLAQKALENRLGLKTRENIHKMLMKSFYSTK